MFINTVIFKWFSTIKVEGGECPFSGPHFFGDGSPCCPATFRMGIKVA
jgi:hypothetical protein